MSPCLLNCKQITQAGKLFLYLLAKLTIVKLLTISLLEEKPVALGVLLSHAVTACNDDAFYVLVCKTNNGKIVRDFHFGGKKILFFMPYYRTLTLRHTAFVRLPIVTWPFWDLNLSCSSKAIFTARPIVVQRKFYFSIKWYITKRLLCSHIAVLISLLQVTVFSHNVITRNYSCNTWRCDCCVSRWSPASYLVILHFYKKNKSHIKSNCFL